MQKAKRRTSDVPIIGGYALFGGAQRWPGEKRLMLAVFEDALNIMVNVRKVTERERDDAQRWIESTTQVHPFSFENVCLVLGLDARRVRRLLADNAIRFRKQATHVVPRLRLAVGTRRMKVSAGYVYFRDNRRVNARPRRAEVA